MRRKSFAQLENGDEFYCWWMNHLEKRIVDYVKRNESTINYPDENDNRVFVDGLTIFFTNGGEWHITEGLVNLNTAVWGTDGWHEYKIIGTSKEGVVKMLDFLLTEDIEKVKTARETYLAQFKKFHPGDKIWFSEEKKPYTVRACDEHFLVCTKPYNFKKERVQYTMVDLETGIRGTDGYSMSPYSYYPQEDCDSYLKELQNGDIEISRRNRIPLKIKKIKQAK